MADFYNNRQQIVRLLFLITGLVLFIRIFALQVLPNDYKEQAQGQSIYKKIIHPARGVIYDRKGKPIVNNGVTYDLYVTLRLAKDFDTLGICNLLDITDSFFKQNLRRAFIKDPFRSKPIAILKTLTPIQVGRLQENILNFPGFELQQRNIRFSEFSAGALAVGYIGEISERMLKNAHYADSGYQKGDYVGINGLERSYEDVLKGKKGINFIVRDNLNRFVRRYKDGQEDINPTPGKSLELFLDGELQAYGEKLMQGKIGSAVAIDPKTGGILAMVSGPSFDPNITNSPERGKLFYELMQDATKPLFNRAIQASYMPGSTFKPLTAIVALDEGVMTPEFGYGCGGSYRACGGKIRCTHAGGGHAANLAAAMGNSCNSYFCHLFRLSIDNPKYGNVKKGLQAWHDHMSKFSLGQKTKVDLPFENKGFIPNSDLYERSYKGQWNSCMNCMVGMGQGEVQLTPIQMATSMTIIANKGYYYLPHFVKSIGGNAKHPMLKDYLVKNQPVHIANEAFEAVHEGMERVVTNGTGTVARMPGVRICAKTGTVENYAIINGKKTKLKNHSMFVAFAPRENPKIVIAVCVENAGFGATWAGPIASLMIEKYLNDTVPTKRKALENKMFNANIIPKTTYLIDAYQKYKDSMREARKLFLADSLKRPFEVRDSIIRANDSLAKKRAADSILYRKKIDSINKDKQEKVLKEKTEAILPDNRKKKNEQQ